MPAKIVSYACAALLVFGCGRDSQRSQPAPPSSAPGARAAAEFRPQARPPQLAPPKRLTSLPISAYGASLALDDDAVYLLTSHAAYRLVEGQPPQGIRLELGIGATLSQSAFVFWSDGGIWNAPKQGGVTRRLAKFSHQPQYFVASGEAFAWVDESEEGLYTIQTLAGNQPRVLVSSPGEIRALNMIGDAVYFVQRPSDGSWRLGVIRIPNGTPEYATERQGRAPALLAGQDALYYYDLDQSKILKRSLDLRSEQVQLENFVCSPISVRQHHVQSGSWLLGSNPRQRGTEGRDLRLRSRYLGEVKSRFPCAERPRGPKLSSQFRMSGTELGWRCHC
jgi:hypothetical protein